MEEEQPRRRERGTMRPTRESCRDKQPMRALNAAAGPNSVIAFKRLSVWAWHVGAAHIFVTQKPGCDK